MNKAQNIGLGAFIVSTAIAVVQIVISKRYDELTFVGILVGFFWYFVAGHFESKASLNDVIATARAGSSGVIVMDAAEAYDYLSRNARKARSIYNVVSVLDAATEAAPYKKWVGALLDACDKNPINVYEIIWEKSDRGRMETMRAFATQKSKRGVYKAQSLPLGVHSSELPFLSYTIMNYDRGGSEVIFGWNSAHENAVETPCFVVREAQFVRFFSTHFDDLRARSTALP